METLPEEMVEKIGRQLTLEELARCCEVSRGWRESFNLDRLWKPFCDPTLEEHLRTTPSVIGPAIPGGEGSTLAPLCQWRLAYLREKQLRYNWKHSYHLRSEALPATEGEIYKEFLTDTIFVRWFPDHFEVWDASSDTAVLVTEYSFDLDPRRWFDSFVENEFLVVRLLDSAKVFTIVDNMFQQEHEIVFGEIKNAVLDFSNVTLVSYMFQLSRYAGRQATSGLGCTKGNVYIHVNANRGNLDVFDLRTGVKIKEEPCPLVDNILNIEISRIFTSPTSDYMVVVVLLKENSANGKGGYFYFYNPRKLCFVQGRLVLGHLGTEYHGEVHSDYFLFSQEGNVTIYNFQSSEAVLKIKSPSSIGFYSLGCDKFLIKGPANCVNIFDLKSRTTETVKWTHPAIVGGKYGSFEVDYKVFNKRMLVGRPVSFCSFFGDCWCLLVENRWVKCHVPFGQISKFNGGFTKAIFQDAQDELLWNLNRPKEWYVLHFW